MKSIILSVAIVAASAATQTIEPQFVERLPLTTTNATREIGIADFDGDGDLDVLLSEVFELVLLVNDGTGRFDPRRLPGASYNFVLPADMDGDGDIDAVVGGGGNVPVLLRNVAGTLTPEPSALSTGLAGEGALVDLDQDGDKDLVWAQLLGTFGVGFNDGSGVLSPGPSPLPPIPGGLFSRFVVADFNGDGFDDFVAGGSRSFFALSSPSGFVAGNASDFLASAASAAADFDGDGHQDLVFVAATGSRILLGAGDGTFARASATFPPIGLQRIAVGDFDEDGDLDIAGVDGMAPSPTPLHLWIDAGGHQFVVAQTTRFEPPTGNTGQRLAVADLDGDRDLDVYVAGSIFGLAPEWDFLAVNRHVHVEVDGPVMLGGTLALGCSSRPGYGAGRIDLFLPVVGVESAAMPTPFGNVHVSPVGSISLPVLALTGPLGHGDILDPVPNNPNLLGQDFVVQALIVELLGAEAPRLTNFERFSIR